SRVEHVLRGPQALRQRCDHRTRHSRSLHHRRALLRDLVERRLATETTAGARDERTLMPRTIDGMARLDRDDVVLLLPLAFQAVCDGVDRVGCAHHSLGEAEADRELEVVARRAHGHGEWLGFLARAVETDLHRLLGGDLVGTLAGR